MALSLLVLLTLMAVARTHEVDGRRMLQFKKAKDIEDVPGFPDSGEYKKLCNKFFGGFGGCKDSKIIRAYNKKLKSKKEEKRKEMTRMIRMIMIAAAATTTTTTTTIVAV